MPVDIVDASVFMGMHNRDESVRSRCKNFFASRLRDKVTMSLEHIGICDDLVWQHPRAVQDTYYPFMDNLHTDMRIDRIGYEEDDLRVALREPALRKLSLRERLLVALAINRGGTVHTVNPRLRHRTDLPVRTVAPAEREVSFSPGLEELYRQSLVLRVGIEEA
jgi:hypothetical protein